MSPPAAPVGASPEVIEHHCNVHPCGTHPTEEETCPCGRFRVVFCSEHRFLVLALYAPGEACEHAKDFGRSIPGLPPA